MPTVRSSAKTKYPGIYKVTRGDTTRYMVSYRLRGLGQRTKTFSTLREARDFQATMRDPVRSRQVVQMEKGRITVSEYFPAWLDRKRQLSESTRDRYEGVGRLFIAAEGSPLSHRYVSHLTKDDVEAWVDWMVEQGASPPSIDKAFRTLRAMLNEAVREQKAFFNAAKGVALPPMDDREPYFLTAAQVDSVATSVPRRYSALVYFLAYTGARIGEASALRVRNLDLVTGHVRIVENSPEVRGRKIQNAKTKTKKTRTNYLSPELVEVLSQHLKEFGPRTSDGQVDQEGFVFTGDRGGQIRQGNWRERVFQPTCRALGILREGRGGEKEVPRVHDLRHTAASLGASAGMSANEVKEMLGHATIGITLDLYTHLFDDDKRSSADALGAVMKGARRQGAEVIDFPDRKAE